MFISSAFAQTAPAAAAGGGAESTLFSLLPLVLMFVVLYFIMIRPQMKKQKEHKAMIEAIAKGDEVIIAGGVMGRVAKLGDSYLGMSRWPRASSCRCSAAPWCRCCPRARSSNSPAGRAGLSPLPQSADQRSGKDTPMNRYPWWKYAILAAALLIGLLYTVPNFYGEAPAVQVSGAKSTVKVDAAMVTRVEALLPSRASRPISCSSTATRCARALPTPTPRSRPRTPSPRR